MNVISPLASSSRPGTRRKPSAERREALGRHMADALRVLAMDAVQKAKSGHPGMPMGMATVATVLWTRFLKFDPSRPRWEDRDRFVLSAGHGSMLLYGLLYLTGYEDMTNEELQNFRQLHSKTPGHPEYGVTAGVDTSTGPLGQGLGNAVGMAIAERLRNQRFGDDIVDHYTYCIVGDGCLMEGISHEAISLAGHLRLSKLIVLWDDNRISIDGPTSLTTSDNQLARFEAAGWDARCVDGENAEAIADAIAMARLSDKPSLIACRTTIGKGAPSKAGSEATHGAPLGEEEVAGARLAMQWPYSPFSIPQHVFSGWRLSAMRSIPERRAWERRFTALPACDREEFERTSSGELLEGWLQIVDELKEKLVQERPNWATRKASGETLNALLATCPEIVGGSADLSESICAKTKASRAVQAENFAGNFIHYGVREHAMSAVMNGIALHGGFIPYGGTFLVFADYMRSGIRMSALMGQRVVYVLTHDSIGVGEDGPTHQPVETIASLRAIPNLLVFRPADAVETVECWAAALAERDRPSCLVLSRQNLPTLRREHVEENLAAKGAYVLREPEGGRDVTLLATGSEVQLALAAADELATGGIRAAVVSMPCFEQFARQPRAYRRQVLGSGPKVAVEAAIRQGWDQWIGPEGGFVGMTGFGASAPAAELFATFDITSAAVARTARELLNPVD